MRESIRDRSRIDHFLFDPNVSYNRRFLNFRDRVKVGVRVGVTVKESIPDRSLFVWVSGEGIDSGSISDRSLSVWC